MARKYQEVMMTSAVQEAQRHYYGRAQTFHGRDSERTPLGSNETAFIALRDSFYIATVSETGWPYVQHRGGSIGFLRVIDANTLAFADFHGNCQLLSTGNLNGGDGRVALFLMDYPRRRRLKVIGHARVMDARDEPGRAKDLVSDPSLLPKVERRFAIDVVSFDWNCPQYITPRYTEEEVRAEFTAPLLDRIKELEASLAVLQSNNTK